MLLCQHCPKTFPVETCRRVRCRVVCLHLIIILAKKVAQCTSSAYDEPPSDAVEASGRKLDELHTELDRYQFPLLQLQTLQVAPLPL